MVNKTSFFLITLESCTFINMKYSFETVFPLNSVKTVYFVITNIKFTCYILTYVERALALSICLLTWNFIFYS